MAFWNRKKENLSISPEKHQPKQESKPEQSLSGRERVVQARESALNKLKGVFQTTVETGKKLVGAFDRVAGKGLEAYDATKAGIAKGSEMAQDGLSYLSDIDVGEWMGNKVVLAVDAGKTLAKKGVEATSAAGKRLYEGGKAAASYVGEGVEGTAEGSHAVSKKTAEIGVGVAAAGTILTVEVGRYAAGKGKEYANAAMDWADQKKVQCQEFVSSNYESLKGWAGQQAENIQQKALAARESFRSGVDRVRGWKNRALEAWHTNRFEAHFSKLSPEAQQACMVRFEQFQGAQELRADINGAA